VVSENWLSADCNDYAGILNCFTESSAKALKLKAATQK